MTLRIDDREALSVLTRAAIGELHAQRLDLMRKPRFLTFEQAGCALEVETGRTIDLDTMERVEG